MAAAPALPEEVQALLQGGNAPTSRQRTEGYSLNQLFNSLGARPYSSRRIPINTLYDMRTDAILRFASLVALTPLFSGKWKIECRNPQLAAFIDKALRRLIGRLYLQFAESHNFGFEGLAKQFGLLEPGWEYIDTTGDETQVKPVWDGGPNNPALVWEPFVGLRPESIAPVWNGVGEFNGIALDGAGGFSFPMVDFAPGDFIAGTNPNDNPNQKKIPITHALWITNERDSQFGSIWGYPRLGYAFKYWWAYEMTLGILNRSVELKGDPTVLVTYPIGFSTLDDGTKKLNQDIAYDVGQMARSGSTLLVPSEVWGMDDGGKTTNTAKWSVQYLKPEDNFDKLRAVLDYLDTMKFRSMGVSELSVAEGSGGTSSRNVAATTGERTMEIQSITQTEWDEQINRYMIPQLVEANFPELRDEPIRKVTTFYGEDEAGLAADLVRAIANSNASQLPVDWLSLLDRLEIDTLSGDALQKFQQRLVEQAEAPQTPPPSDSQAGGNAGVDENGFYYPARELIVLSDDDKLIEQLPQTKHYLHADVLKQTRLIRKLWASLLAAQIDDFAAHVEADDIALSELELADDDEETRRRKIVEALLSSWKFSAAKLGKAVQATSKALASIFARAGQIELESASIPTDGWNPDEKELAQWVKDNAAMLVRNVEETTRKQLNAFLLGQVKRDANAPKIAAALKEHFSGISDRRADLIAREETRKFYNAATLFAAKASGVKVQALDARKGPTDERCEQRNMQIFDVATAWREEAEEHVRGTLAWRLLPKPAANLVVEHLPASEMGDYLAHLDEESGTIFIQDGLTRAVEAKHLEQVVDYLLAQQS